ncbi:MAG TPA: hypothetical protein VFV02_13655, partial [Acidimicrobiales bacterium]|nr:hypothetical protein [Acidimicrobiales bacterium]
MDEPEGRRRIARIQESDSLKGLTTRAGDSDTEYHLKAKLSFEWGLARDKSSAEVILIVGSGGS